MAFLFCLCLDVSHPPGPSLDAAHRALGRGDWRAALMMYRRHARGRTSEKIEDRIRFCSDMLDSRATVRLSMAHIEFKRCHWAVALNHYEQLLKDWGDTPTIRKNADWIQACIAKCKLKLKE